MADAGTAWAMQGSPADPLCSSRDTQHREYRLSWSDRPLSRDVNLAARPSPVRRPRRHRRPVMRGHADIA